MSFDLAPLQESSRVLFTVPLVPLQGQRFQPTGFPGLGAATFQSKNGACLLVESAQSMANRLETTIWDDTKQDLAPDLEGLSHVRVLREEKFLTDSILEAHRLNSPYIEKSQPVAVGAKQIHASVKDAVFPNGTPLLDRNRLAETLLRYDVGSLIHGVFLESIDGRIRVARALSTFIEADGVRVVPSGGVKNDRVNPSGDAKAGFGNVPFARDEFTADRITLYANLDLVQIRGYGLGPDVERMLELLALYKLRALLDGRLRLRTACDLRVDAESVVASLPKDWPLPSATDLRSGLKAAIGVCKPKMTVETVTFNDELKKGKEQRTGDGTPDDDDTGDEANGG